MLRPRQLLVDTNVWMTYFLAGNQYEEVVTLFEAAACSKATLTYAPTTLKDVFYLIPRQLRRDALAAGDDVSDRSFLPAAWASVRSMTEIAAAVPVSLPDCDIAWMLRGRHEDLEDNLIIAIAETSNADYVVTYDKELLRCFAPVCITPAQALDLLTLIDAEAPSAHCDKVTGDLSQSQAVRA